jgi:hypothetical protein
VVQVQELLETAEGLKMVDLPFSAPAPTGDAESRGLQRHHLVPDSVVEYEVEDGVWWPAVVVSSLPGAEHVTVRYHRPGAQAPIGEAPLSRETKLDKKSPQLRVPSDSPKDFTALMCACMLDAEADAHAMAALLLKHQADPDRTDSDGFSAVHWAAVQGHPSVLKLLFDSKASVDASSSLSGETPLLLAARYGRKDAVEVLLSHGARCDARTRQRMGLLEVIMAGRGQGCTDVLHLVLQRQPALRTMLLHTSAAGADGRGCQEEAGLATNLAQAVAQRYAPELLTVEDFSFPGTEDLMNSLVRKAVEQVVKGNKRNCCCCLPFSQAAGRATASNSSNGATKGGARHLELTAALHAAQVDESMHRVAILDLDGRLYIYLYAYIYTYIYIYIIYIYIYCRLM